MFPDLSGERQQDVVMVWDVADTATTPEVNADGAFSECSQCSH